MSSYTIVMHLHVSANDFEIAARHLRDGQGIANPLALALYRQAGMLLAGCSTERIILKHAPTRQRCVGSVSPDLADYLTRFWRGEMVLGDHTFELLLESDESGLVLT